MSTENGFGDIVSGTMVKIPKDDKTYMVGEIYKSSCKLKNYDGECIGVFKIKKKKKFTV